MDGAFDDDYAFDDDNGSYFDDMSEFEDYAMEKKSGEGNLGRKEYVAQNSFNSNIGWMLCCILVGFTCVSRR